MLAANSVCASLKKQLARHRRYPKPIRGSALKVDKERVVALCREDRDRDRRRTG